MRPHFIESHLRLNQKLKPLPDKSLLFNRDPHLTSLRALLIAAHLLTAASRIFGQQLTVGHTPLKERRIQD